MKLETLNYKCDIDKANYERQLTELKVKHEKDLAEVKNNHNKILEDIKIIYI